MAMIIITVGEKKVDQLGLECSQRYIGGELLLWCGKKSEITRGG